MNVGQSPGSTQCGVRGWATLPLSSPPPPPRSGCSQGRQSMTAENAEKVVLKVQQDWHQQGAGF